MSFMKTGDWRIVMLVDGTDTEGKATYQHIYQHRDGRKACVGNGYCSDPDLEWLLLQKDRQMKAWSRRHTKRKKVSHFVLNSVWIYILIQGCLAFLGKGAWVLLSILGYWATQSFSCGVFHNLRNLVIPSTNYLYEPKNFFFSIFGCLIFIFIGHWLIDIGKFNNLSIVFLQLPLLWFGCCMGLIEELLQNWKDEEFVNN